MGFALRYKINPVLMGLMIINGATAGGFSPISIFGSITNGVVERNDLEGSPLFLFLGLLRVQRDPRRSSRSRSSAGAS